MADLLHEAEWDLFEKNSTGRIFLKNDHFIQLNYGRGIFLRFQLSVTGAVYF